ncbi:hypothetical protein H6G00_33115 [Leptolyngbya sp. FACHB-541]|uniref:hypothetical protein n=1 Tax=Leptolyngbya sp. FACHB-541 TaxID=2692810 RepID=UPI00168409ED|nr:hypothetical protein [Leptolyngbya sp. FACHB-541]MBD2001382.1 hypothetical protein [Leptolyngbya sp. FACHB-541]
MSDRNFNNFNDDFDDDFEDDDFEDDLLDASGRGAREIGGDRNSAVLRPFIQEIEQIPPEHLANLLQMVRLFRQSVALAERTARTEAQNSLPIQPTVLPPVAPIDTAPIDTPSIAPDVTPIAPSEKPTGIDPIEKLLLRSRFEPSSNRTTEQVTKPPTESSQEPPRIPLRLPRTSEANVEPAAPVEVAVGEYGVRPASTEDESDWDELMDFLDQDNPKDFREEEEDDSRNDDWDEYFRPSP